MTNLGPITGPDGLRYFSMKGLAVAPTSCVPEGPGGTPEPAQLPANSSWAMLLLGLLILIGSAVQLRKRRA